MLRTFPSGVCAADASPPVLYPTPNYPALNMNRGAALCKIPHQKAAVLFNLPGKSYGSADAQRLDTGEAGGEVHLVGSYHPKHRTGKPTYMGTIMKLAQALGVQAQDCMLASGPLRPFRGVGPWSSVACVEADVPPCPYRGLLAFREEDAELFFGRQNLVELLNETVSHKSITQVSGPSGSGKSSLICAGLIPALKRSKFWQVMYCRPGADPFQSLATLLMPYLEPGLDEISRAAQFPKLTRVLEDGQLGYLVERVLLSGGNKRLLFFIDQFEELYTQCTRDETRQRFLDSLLTLSRATSCAGQPAIKLIYTVRADFISRLMSNRDFTDAIQASDVKIGPMDPEELDSVIRKPALHHGVQFEDGLAERILNDAGREPGVLPLIQFALAELWQKQRDRTLTHAAYEQVGQLSGAIANRAETVFRSLTLPEQEAAQHILTRLVRVADECGEDTRQRIAAAALYGEEQLNTDCGRRVLEVLTEARLITLGLGDDLHQENVEIAHEALIRRWPRLGQWLQEDREILIWRPATPADYPGMATNRAGRRVSLERTSA